MLRLNQTTPLTLSPPVQSPYNLSVSKPVILAGFAPSRYGVEKLDPAIELWSVNHSWQYWQEGSLGAVFEIHPYAYLQDHAYYANRETARLHQEYLLQPHPYPIYMIEAYPEVPAAVRYPIEDALALLPESSISGEMREYVGAIDAEVAARRYFSSSFAYQMALAMLQNRNPIYVWGYDMATDTEWFYQRPNCEWWIGFAQGKGFDVIVSSQSPLCKVKKMYGYEGYQMVDRGVLEARKNDYKKQFSIAKEQFDRWQGILLERDRKLKEAQRDHVSKNKLDAAKKELDEAAQQCRVYENTAAMCDGALQSVQNLLDECDLVPSNIPVFGMSGVKGNA
jgi:hypothetical protein